MAEIASILTFMDQVAGAEGLRAQMKVINFTRGEPPFVTAATLGPDGRTVTWAEGPEHSRLEDAF